MTDSTNETRVLHILRPYGNRTAPWKAYDEEGHVVDERSRLDDFRDIVDATIHRGTSPNMDAAWLPEVENGRAVSTDGSTSVYWTVVPAWTYRVLTGDHRGEPSGNNLSAALHQADTYAASEFGPEAPDGVYHNVERIDYLKHPALSRSTLHKGAMRSMQHAKHAHDEPPDIDAESLAMQTGTATHIRVLEADRFDDIYDVAPDTCSDSFADERDCTYSAKHRVGGRWYCGRHVPDGPTDDVNVLSKKQQRRINGMTEALRQDSDASMFLWDLDGTEELTLLWTNPETGLRCKARIDRVIDTSSDASPGRAPALVDLKTADSAHPGDFSRSVGQYGYWLQSPFYQHGFEVLTGVRPSDFLFVAVDSAPPYAVQVYRLDALLAEKATARMYELLVEFATCDEHGDFPGYGQGVQPITPRPYQSRRLNIYDEV